MPSRPLKDWVMLLALAAFWGSNYMFVKLGLSAVPPATLVAARLTVGAVVLVAVVRALGYTFPPRGRAWRAYVVIALVGNCLPFWFIAWGQQHVESALAGILMGFMPLVTLLLAHRFAPGERMTFAQLGGFGLGFLGVIVLMGPAALASLGGTPTAMVAQASVLCGAICYSVTSVISSVTIRSDLMVASAATIAIAALVSVPVALVLDAPWRLAPGWNAVALILWIGIGPTAIATFIYFTLIRSAGPTFMSMMNYLVPCVALGFGVAFLGEDPGMTTYLGLAFILAGIAVSQLRRAPAAPRPS